MNFGGVDEGEYSVSLTISNDIEERNVSLASEVKVDNDGQAHSWTNP